MLTSSVKKKPASENRIRPAAAVSAVTKPQVKGTKAGAPLSNRDIAARALRIWKAKGSPKGCDVEIWLEAEQQLTGKVVPPSHKDIAAQAVKIWREKGCPDGCDDVIWVEAERQLTEQQQRFERFEPGRKQPVVDFNAADIIRELDALFPAPYGRGVMTSL
jgi:hypothetical protein